MATQRPGRAVISPNLGLYLGLPPLLVPERGLQAGQNMRIQQGRLVFDNLGWSPFPNSANAVNLDGKPVLLIDSFQPRGGIRKTVMGNTTDLFIYDEGTETVAYLTPRYETGTVDVTNGSAIVSGTATSWSGNLKAGDFIHIGATGETDPTATWYEIDSVDSNTQLTLTANYTGSTDTGLGYTARSVLTGDIRSVFSTEVFFSAVDVVGTDGDRWYATNGVDAVMGWDGVADQVYRPSLGIDTTRFLKRFKGILYYVAPTVSGEERVFSVRTSDLQKPEDVTNGAASEFVVHDGADELLCAFPIGDLLAIYGARSVTLAQFVGAPLQFVFRSALSDFGPRSSRAVAVFPDHHEFIGADAQYYFDGTAARPINSHVWRDITRRMSPQRLDLLHSVFDEENGELLWCTPLNTDADSDDGNPETAYSQHYLEAVGERRPMPFMQRELPALTFGFFERIDTLTWDAIADQWEDFNYRWNDQFLQAAFPQILFGDIAGNVFILNESTSKDGTAMTAFARFSRRPLASNPAQKGTVKRIYPFLEQTAGAEFTVDVRLRIANRADGPAQLVASQTFDMDSSQTAHFVAPRKSGRYAEVEFRATGADYWAITGYDMETGRAGRR